MMKESTSYEDSQMQADSKQGMNDDEEMDCMAGATVDSQATTMQIMSTFQHIDPPVTYIEDKKEKDGLSAAEKMKNLEYFWKERTRQLVQQRVPIVDQADISDPQAVSEYAEDCHSQMLRTERLFSA